MGWFNFLKRKDKVREEVEEELPIVAYPVCDYCGFEICGTQRIKKFAGKIFHHKPCFRQILKTAKKSSSLQNL